MFLRLDNQKWNDICVERFAIAQAPDPNADQLRKCKVEAIANAIVHELAHFQSHFQGKHVALEASVTDHAYFHYTHYFANPRLFRRLLLDRNLENWARFVESGKPCQCAITDEFREKCNLAALGVDNASLNVPNLAEEGLLPVGRCRSKSNIKKFPKGEGSLKTLDIRSLYANNADSYSMLCESLSFNERSMLFPRGRDEREDANNYCSGIELVEV
jgi:hypothetical protein